MSLNHEHSVINTVKLSIYTGEKKLLKITGNILDSEVVSLCPCMEFDLMLSILNNAPEILHMWMSP